MTPGADERAPRALCLFTGGSRRLGVGLEAVAEIVEAGRLVRLPLCPRQVLGLRTYRGKIVPILGLPPAGREPAPAGEGRDNAYLILKTTHGPWGLAIDRGGVAVEEAPGLDAPEGPPLPGGFVASGAFTCRGLTYAILDPDRSWAGLKGEIERWYGHAMDRHRPAPAARPTPA